MVIVVITWKEVGIRFMDIREDITDVVKNFGV